MKYSLKEYLNAEIPSLSNKNGIKWLLTLWKIRRYNPSYDAIFLIRYCYVYQESGGIKKYLRKRCRRLLVNRYNIFLNIGKESVIGKGLFLPHPTSIVIGAGVNIGDNCTIYQNVTFGAKKRSSNENQIENLYPQIGDNCIFYANSVMIGSINVRNGTQVGANAVLICDTEENSIYAGVPAVKK